MKNELVDAVRLMIENLPNWKEDAVIYRYADGNYECSPQSVYESVAREYDVEKIIQVHDLDEFGNIGVIVEDAQWIAEQIENL